MTDNKQPGFKVVIPARFASSRLPGKPLLDLGGKPMVVRVAERARESGAEEVIVACDHPDVLAAVEQHGFVARLTRSDHPSGTDRLAEIVEREGWGDETLVVNVQGDEPLIDPALIARLAGRLAGLSKDEASIVTAAYPVQSAADFFSPNVVKVVCAESGRALYFSRAPVPWARDAFAIDTGRQQPSPGSLHHIGIYAYRCHFLKVYSTLSPSPLEQIESLEQLRALAHGFNIHVIREAAAPMAGVDTPEDALRIKQWFDQEAEYR